MGEKFTQFVSLMILIALISIVSALIILGGTALLERKLKSIPRCFPPFTMVDGGDRSSEPTCRRISATDDGVRSRAASHAVKQTPRRGDSTW